jgi:hypothetical protein
MLWIVYALQSAWYSEQVEYFGEAHSGLCVGGPALALMILAIIGFEIYTEGRRQH